MVLHDMGYLDFDEPFPNFYAHGLIIKDGAKMSKSKGNVINPDEYINKYGADVFRLYLSFIGPYADGGDFRDSGIAGMQKFLGRIWRLYDSSQKDLTEDEVKALESIRHKTIKKVTKGIERFKYNTAIAGLMEYLRELERIGIGQKDLKTFILLLAPFAPYISEELWQKINNGEFVSVQDQDWPEYSEAKMVSDKIMIVVQINGKVRTNIKVNADEAENEKLVIEKVKGLRELDKYIREGEIKREIFVKGKLVNLVV
jgi:leucyl-tRNA synthetase